MGCYRYSSKSTGTLDHPSTELQTPSTLRRGLTLPPHSKSRSKRAFTSSRPIIQKSGHQRPRREIAGLPHTDTPQAPFGNSSQSGDFQSPAISLEHSMSCTCSCDVLRRTTYIPASDSRNGHQCCCKTCACLSTALFQSRANASL